LAGLSVTMPHKAAVHDAVDERTPVAAALGAVNCVYWRGDRLVGDNTGGAGFLDALRADEGVEVGGRRCVVVGAGGAGRAVAHALGGAGAAEVVVVNRSPGPAARAAEPAGAAGRVCEPADVARADLVVRATARGAAERGAVAINGFGMLVHQAAHAFRRWTGQEPPVAAMREATARELARRAPPGADS